MAFVDDDRDEDHLFNNLNPDQKLDLAQRYVDELRTHSRSMAAAGRLDMIGMLDEVANDLEANASQLSAAMIGMEVLARAASLLESIDAMEIDEDELGSTLQ
ncbi:hypothetical protein [Rhizobium sp. 768_B6_N1_8]|uniref:hypothetical protein n=1 Tax=unclassified Rhizobium TaxID=2613769 RepID=UPI003F24DE86